MVAKRHKGSITIEYQGPFDPNRDTYTSEYKEFLIGDELNLVWHPFGGDRPNYSNLEVINVINRAETKCMAKLGDMKVDIGTALAESKKGYQMMSDAFKDLVYAARSIRRGNLGLAAKHLGVKDPQRLGGRYLEYEYGWKPLVGVTLDGYDTLKSGLDRSPMFKAVKRERLSSSSNPNWGSGKYHGKTKADLLVEVGLLAMLDDYYKRAAHQTGLINPALVGWELIPLSFVIDWLVPVGTVIEALSATSGLTLIDGWRSVTVDAEFDVQQDTYSGFDADQPAKLTGDYKCFERVRISSFPRPKPYIQSPFKSKVALNAAALLSQLR